MGAVYKAQDARLNRFVAIKLLPESKSGDPSRRRRFVQEAQAASALNDAKARITAAQQRKAAASPQYQQAAQQFANASTLNAGAKSNDDLRQVINVAQSAASIADLAVAPGAPAVAAAAPPPTRPVAASTMVLGDTARRVRQALESYFRGAVLRSVVDYENFQSIGWIVLFPK